MIVNLLNQQMEKYGQLEEAHKKLEADYMRDMDAYTKSGFEADLVDRFVKITEEMKSMKQKCRALEEDNASLQDLISFLNSNIAQNSHLKEENQKLNYQIEEIKRKETQDGFIESIIADLKNDTSGVNLNKIKPLKDKEKLLRLACACLDSNVILTVIFFLKQTLSRELFLDTLCIYEDACFIYTNYLRKLTLLKGDVYIEEESVLIYQRLGLKDQEDAVVLRSNNYLLNSNRRNDSSGISLGGGSGSRSSYVSSSNGSSTNGGSTSPKMGHNSNGGSPPKVSKKPQKYGTLGGMWSRK
eukprot:TRINITY_DN11713_c0_g1_i1.p1 TRINITY_DN11713_c0_g1~~TRINITY_DN11713_c0_g1_i1.p1  ORF type:complete len:336 (-),score=64.44 TRINITY_DN11713_c0_g1_i1:50-946(-)